MPGSCDVVVVGGGQGGLAAGYYLRRAGLDYVILDAQSQPGGAWGHGWDSLRLFSPAEYSPLPGWGMPRQEGEDFPTAGHVVDYLRAYEQRYDLRVRRPVRAHEVRRAGERLAVETDAGRWLARYVISATGTWECPYVPDIPGREEFAGRQLHTVNYASPEEFRGQRVVIVGGGNSAAQILAEVSRVAETTWVTLRPARFMPDTVDGRVLFGVATRKAAGGAGGGVSDLGDIVMVPSIRDARERAVLHSRPMFVRLTDRGVRWADGAEQPCEAVIWCTGFQPDLAHLAPLLPGWRQGKVAVEGTRSMDEARLYLLGYGDWTGPASATLVGAGRTAKATVADIATRLRAA
ncbi:MULTISPECIES: ArsO family NAD(P)H-dependent flavin-containing monooxygenase [Micromonospora]|uniref:NAD(P)/FAD-dependent oxidoreductase n=1 Tax=Micromonospora aurantiaca (nom. illeg.) TaxID=47850 RepID=A0ABQ6U6Q3_9ACTN|nr:MULTISPECIES: ArsO family NAD(P)H-dependent flavin-containing monooxygenase [Micromonospora]KAB1100209.1 NAD(P)/FAD-dependent oxidoreductase [Micromonospora aurantiaca]MBC8993716.1 NAD(P)/FAD-dependent oxidoreductase [Micromonospora chalcea]MCT2278980.1 ArsO family NAD(P)H-dependent flavin-containing monooxygenase [Micromonospora chalcea]RNH97623.1 NAD(P)/FAD-dependent oxidoreductase [Micromonospora aurantiaca]